jgi:hypothetical protein
MEREREERRDDRSKYNIPTYCLTYFKII